jgi:site-specific recombinase XerC
MTWEEFTDNYNDEKLLSLAEATAEAAYSSFNHVTQTINPQRLGELTTSRLADFQLMLRREGMRETTIATHLRQLKAALNWAVRRGYLRTMPGIEMPQRAKGVTQVMRGRAVTE